MEKAKYSEDWTDKIRPGILKRDGYKCQECGLVHKRYIFRTEKGHWMYIEKDEYEEYKKNKKKVYRVFLQVAHLDCDKSNNDHKNLRTLCLWCHLKYDRSWKKLVRLSKKKDNATSHLINQSFESITGKNSWPRGTGYDEDRSWL